VAALRPEFDRRGVKVIGLSVDPVESHHVWEKDITDVTGQVVNFPMIADPDRRVATLYDMIHPNASENATVRSVFVVGPDHKVKLTLTAVDGQARGRHPGRLETGPGRDRSAQCVG
jgi:alkyl hydroperoxide reductase subunit AhpC